MPHISINIDFEWYPWTGYQDLIPFQKHQSRGPVPSRAGVYELSRADTKEVLFIGSSTKLTRLYDMLSGRGTRERSLISSLREEVQGDVSLLAIRWAEMDECKCRAVECELLRQYVRDNGKLPKYVRQ